MRLFTSVCLLVGTFLPGSASAQKFADLAATPPMGWNSWNTFSNHISEELVKETAQAMITSGMRDAGYTYIVLDDTWSLRERDAQGDLVPDPEKFPSGLKALGDYLHAHGFKFGIYSCAGRRTCADFPGSQGHEYQDARRFAAWGVDYLKYDWCNTDTRDAREAYTTIRDAVHAAGRPVVLSMCEWGRSRPWEWAAEVGHLWRTTGDIYDSYDGVKMWEMGWKRIVDLQSSLVDDWGPNGLAKYAGPGHWNDPDMLEVGNHGLTLAESRAHFTLWAMLAAPLMAGNDVTAMSPEITAILTDPEVIAIDQDVLGKQGYRVLREDAQGVEIFVKELSDGDWAICVLNTAGNAQDLTIDWGRLFMVAGPHTLRDVWAKAAAGDTTQATTRRIGSHDVLLLRATPVRP